MSSKNRKNGVPKKHGFSKTEKIAFPIIIIIIVVFAGWAYYSSQQPPTPGGSSSLPVTSASVSVTQSGLAPDFTLPVVNGNGQTLTLSSLRGKVILLEFMEPWCPHCQRMTQILDPLWARYGGNNSNVVFISVAGPWDGATQNDAANFITQYGSTWTYLYDGSGTIMSSYGVSSTPTFFIIGKDGSITSPPLVGEQTTDTLVGAIQAAGGT
ncbi:MAG TPA: TlpA disulfide reductase family protein [Terriglobales bacterium]|nr:TlpA disulfide reductase family protein [Terriglobales bacterium]